MSKILEFLFLGRYQDSLNHGALLSLGITHILNVMESSKIHEKSSFHHLHLPISDFGDSDLNQVLNRCSEFIDRAEVSSGKVLLHCGRGQNRSPTVATAYLMKSKGMNLKSAFELVRERRPQFAPHENYFAFLQNLDRELFGKLSLTEDDQPLSIQAISRKIASTIE